MQHKENKKIISVIIKNDSEDIKGEFLSAHSRLLNLMKITSEYSFNPFIIKVYDGLAIRFLKRQHKIDLYERYVYDDINYNILWIKSSLIDIILSKFGIERFVIYRRLNKLVTHFKKSDLILAHSSYPGWLASECKRRYGTQVCVTWHGSDIHTTPWESKGSFRRTKDILHNVDMNIFVSYNLLNKSKLLSKKDNKIVLYNGVDQTVFYNYSVSLRNHYKELLKIKNRVNIAFIGNLYPVKNVLLLPLIYEIVSSEYDDICLHIIGDGPLLPSLKDSVLKRLLNVRFWGNQKPDIIPSIINVMDLIMLPSINEGLPLIALETTACGIPMISSNVGGLPEILGDDSVFDLDDDFINKFSHRCIEVIRKKIPPKPLSTSFLWTTTAQKEYEIIRQII